jgi:hypothetical protein
MRQRRRQQQRRTKQHHPLFSRHLIETVNDAKCPLIEG